MDSYPSRSHCIFLFYAVDYLAYNVLRETINNRGKNVTIDGIKYLVCGVKSWDGFIPERRYAIFNDIITGDYMIVVKGNDILTASKWGGFIKWVGSVRPSETRSRRFTMSSF